MIQFWRPPRFAADLKVIHVDVNPTELGHNRPVDVPIAGDARAVLEQLLRRSRGQDRHPSATRPGRRKLRSMDDEKRLEMDKAMSNDQTPIHPLRLCKEVRDFMRRDAILVVDGQEILNFGRQSIPTFVPGHRLNSGRVRHDGRGPAVRRRREGGEARRAGAGAARRRLLRHQCAWRSTRAVRHKIPVVVVISNNGGWTADAPWTRLTKPGRNLGYTRYDQVAQELGAHGEYVEKPTTSARRSSARAPRASRRWSTSSPTPRRARTTVRFSAYTT